MRPPEQQALRWATQTHTRARARVPISLPGGLERRMALAGECCAGWSVEFNVQALAAHPPQLHGVDQRRHARTHRAQRAHRPLALRARRTP
eukprot:4534450-Prymnesium_polylepis.1